MINVGTNWNVAQVKQAILTQAGLQPNQFKLVFAGQELKDQMTLEVQFSQLIYCYHFTSLPSYACNNTLSTRSYNIE